MLCSQQYRHRNGSEEDRGFFGVPGGYWNPPGKLMGLLGHSGEREAATGGGAPLPSPIRIGQGVGARPPFPSPSPPFPLFPSPLEGRRGGRILPGLGVQVR